MPQVINTNIASLNAQRNLNETQGDANTALERLSSGLRINSAKDDAAGLAISERFTAQINGLNQAVRNANDGISLAQVTEGALGESANSLQRIRELAIQSANATNSQSDRDALQAEVSQLKEEIDRIATQTEFNGLRVLDGSYTDQQYQVGANANQTIGISIESAEANQIGSVVNEASNVLHSNGGGTGVTVAEIDVGGGYGGTDPSAQSGADEYTGVNDAATGSDLIINGETVANSGADQFTGPGESQKGDSAYAKAAAINGSAIDGVTAIAETEKTLTGINASGAQTGDNSNLVSFDDNSSGADSGTYTLSINDTQVIQRSLDGSNTSITLSDAESRINQYTDTTGVRANINTSGELVLSAEDGRNISIGEDIAMSDGDTNDNSTMYSIFQDGVTAGSSGGTDSITNDYTYRGEIRFQSLDNVSIDSGNSTIGFDKTLLEIDDDENVSSIDISTVKGANDAILAVDSALRTINSIRADLGAVQNRFESTIANLESGSENLSAARSRIEDADFAKESAELSRTQTLQQAGLSVLSQANQRPQQVLQLLQG